jgi:hypothetical protein
MAGPAFEGRIPFKKQRSKLGWTGYMDKLVSWGAL